MEIQLDILTYDIANGDCLLRFILSIRTILDCLRNRITNYNLAARKAVLYDRLLRLHQHQFIIPVVRQRQIEATHINVIFVLISTYSTFECSKLTSGINSDRRKGDVNSTI